MTDILVIGAVALGLLYFAAQSSTGTTSAALPPTQAIASSLVPAATPAQQVPLAAPILGTSSVPSSYATVPAATAPAAGRPGSTYVLGPNSQNFSVLGGNLLAQALGRIGAVSPSTPLPPPPPYVFGGIASGFAAGGNPLGGLVRPGLSLGTGTTVVIPAVTPVIS